MGVLRISTDSMTDILSNRGYRNAMSVICEVNSSTEL